MDKLQLFVKASRFRVLPVMMIPVILGGIGAFAWEGTFRPLLFLLTLIGAGAAHLFSNMINDLWDFRNGVDAAAKETAATISTNSGMLAGSVMPERTFRLLTWSLFGIAAVCGIILAAVSGWPIIAISGLGGLLAYFYVAPPIKFGYRGKGYSEIAILLAFGVLPVAGTYYVQLQQFDYRAVLLSLPIGLLTTLLLFNHHFLHWRADEQAGKRTLVVVWGEKRSLQFSKWLAALAYLALAACILFGALPDYAIIAIVTAAPLVNAYRSLQAENPSTAYLPLMGASLKASVRCGLVMGACLLIEALFQLI